MDVELVARNSLSSLQRINEATFIVSPGNLEDWSWANLRKQFKNKNLERLYLIYCHKLENGYMSLFVVLQLFLSIVHCIILIYKVTELEQALIDLIAMGTVNALIFPLIALYFRTNMTGKKVYLPIYFSSLIIAFLVVGDLIVVIYHTLTSRLEKPLTFRPSYPTHTLLVCYIFLPLPKNIHAFILGVTASLCYLASFLLITYWNDSDVLVKMASEFMYHACINCLGLYFRFMNEIMIRRSFLDRRKYVESTLRLNYEKDQEEQLTLSILPPHIAAKIKKNFRDICKFMEEQKKSSPFNDGKSTSSSSSSSSSTLMNLYVEAHDNVSILYADVVNFSGLTVTLPVKKLVETLNDLFGSFDEASARHNVLRIKFLGDCYYCVSGVPLPNPQHAKSCVDLGLDMINIINGINARVRRECGVDVNMRIGVHSGKIISGILGMNKWQYDVWSRDVIIANVMEQTGEAGKVHVTEDTLSQLDVSSYDCAAKDNADDQVLRKYGIFRTYLITPVLGSTPIIYRSTMKSKFIRSDSTLGLCSKSIHGKCSQADLFNCTSRRRTHFMDSCLRDYHLMLKAADAEMEKAIEQMPLSKWKQWCKWENINPLFLTFSRISWEIPYLREPDPLFKFYVACAATVLFFIGGIIFFPISSINKSSPCLVSTTLASYAMTLTFVVFLIPTTWTQFLWSCYKDSYDESENAIERRPTRKIINTFYQISVKVVWNEVLRIILYFMITATIAIAAVFILLVECDAADPDDAKNNDTNNDTSDRLEAVCISSPWPITNTCALAIFSTFIFLRIHVFLKLFTGISIATFYAWNVMNFRSGLFELSCETWNPYITNGLAHILTVTYLTFSLHLIDRQAEYLNRLNYLWKRQLTKEQDEAFYTRNANKLLLRNILPEHVADFYLNMDRTGENALYHEAHDNVAVMFATLSDLMIEDSNVLADFNEIICHFDRLLFEPNFTNRIEKIKLAGTTYMAACGLETFKINSQRSDSSCDDRSNYNVVQVMVEFAAEMMATLEKMTAKSSKSYRLRIGVSHGEVTAGVVGAQKPLYDIWGDAVNMASRMDTTGVPGKMQVTKDTAQVLEEEGIRCHLRGETWVKPKGLVTTYFVGLDDKTQLEKIIRDNEETSL